MACGTVAARCLPKGEARWDCWDGCEHRADRPHYQRGSYRGSGEFLSDSQLVCRESTSPAVSVHVESGVGEILSPRRTDQQSDVCLDAVDVCLHSAGVAFPQILDISQSRYLPTYSFAMC